MRDFMFIGIPGSQLEQIYSLTEQNYMVPHRLMAIDTGMHRMALMGVWCKNIYLYFCLDMRSRS
jgi:hypothetical protein